ncbi:MAG: rRNA large subunit methyltransferase I [Rhodobacterales bacterium]|nr:rRNA large subunit methyltransferase I [Rhodobacterales bacterium]
MSLPMVQLRNKKDRRVKGGHPWVFSNEIDGDIKALPAGGAVGVYDSKGAFIGRGYANPKSLITVRIASRRKDDIDHVAFWAMKIREAVELRHLVYPGRQSMRLIHADADGLPGLVVDRYGDYLAVQLTTLGTEQRKEIIGQALQQVLSPKGAVLRSEGRNRQLEGLEDERCVWFGDIPEHVEIDELGVKFQVPLLGGQKTGHFFDQTENRAWAGQRCAGKTVLDVYANGAGWALHALHNGAKHSVAVDKSPDCAAMMTQNAALNGVTDRLDIVQAEGKKFLTQLCMESQQFDVVMLDPPAFAKTRKAANSALRGYTEVNKLGLQLTAAGGLFFTSSCSFHVDEANFIAAVMKGAQQAGRSLRMVRRGEQSSDHPVHPAIPESRYLKSYAFEVRMA